jgi:glutathione-specific gamma-glutamylcyclotransferase
MWIFGYGSLIWRPDFEFEEAKKVCLDGWERVFSQGSPDHRGTPEAPGRVVTLRRNPEASCWGRAYRVRAAVRDAILARLDHREQGGYERVTITLRSAMSGEARFEGMTYVAPPGNPHDLGLDSLASMVDQIAGAHGPSGPNRDYILRLQEALELMDVHDPCVSIIADALVERPPA